MLSDRAFIYNHAYAYASGYQATDVETAHTYARWYTDAYGDDITSAPDHPYIYHAGAWCEEE